MSSGQDSRSFNPYAPVLETAVLGSQTDAEATRRLYLNHEASVKAIGFLFALGGFFLSILAIFQIAAVANMGMVGATEAIIVASMFAVLGPLQLSTGIALRKLKPWSRIVAAVFSAIGLIAFPIGTLINGYFLYLLLGKKGTFVFSPEYAAILEATPHIKYKISKWVIGLLVVVLVFLALVIAAALLGTRPTVSSN